jgi:hypothetical protein
MPSRQNPENAHTRFRAKIGTMFSSLVTTLITHIITALICGDSESLIPEKYVQEK